MSETDRGEKRKRPEGGCSDDEADAGEAKRPKTTNIHEQIEDEKEAYAAALTADPENPDIPYGPTQQPWASLVPAYAAGIVNAPSDNPVDVYPAVPPPDAGVGTPPFPVIDYTMFELPPTGLTPEQQAAAHAALKVFCETQHATFAGFQANQDESYSAQLSWLLNMHSNNIGDPYSTGAFTLNTKFCERAVIDYFAALWNIDWPNSYNGGAPGGDPDRVWGYVLTMGFTEGNIYGLFNARDYLMGRALLEETADEAAARIGARTAKGKSAVARSAKLVGPAGPASFNDIVGDGSVGHFTPDATLKPLVFYSEDVHYSVIKAVRVLDASTFGEEGNAVFPGQCPIPTVDGAWPAEVPSHDVDEGNPASGTVNVESLAALVEFFVARGYPVIVVANIGTTWKGAYDDVPAINQMFLDLGSKYPWLWERTFTNAAGQSYTRRGFWLHVDGALGAAYLPFIEMAHAAGKLDHAGPVFDFRNPAVMSIGCSMHKWLGGPWPSGVFLTRRRYQLQPPDAPGFLGALDTTLGGSRSGFSPAVLWDYFARNSYDDNVAKVVDTENVSAYLFDSLTAFEGRLRDQFPREDVALWIARSDLALTVRFRQPNASIVYKWTIDTDTVVAPLDATTQQRRSFGHIYVMHSVTAAKVDAFIADLQAACDAAGSFAGAFPAQIDGEANPGPVEPIGGAAAGAAAGAGAAGGGSVVTLRTSLLK